MILLVIIFGILENRGDVTDINQLRNKLLRLKDLFKNTERSVNGPGNETYSRLIQLYYKSGAQSDDKTAIKSKHLLTF